MVRFKGGSPKNMRQGQYWVRRHLDDQKRQAAAQRRAAASVERDRKARTRAAIADEKERQRLHREYAAAKRRLVMWEHFEKAQNQLEIALGSLTTGEHSTYKMDIAFEKEDDVQKLGELQRTYQEHADWLNDNHDAITATALSKHIQNIKRMLTQLAKGLGKKTRWNRQEKTLRFGELLLDFSSPEPIPDSTTEKQKAKAEADQAPRGPDYASQWLEPEALIAPIGILHPMFLVLAIVVLLIAACVVLLN